MNVCSIIYSVDLKNKIFSIYKDNRLHFFYLKNYLMKKYKRYLYSGNYIEFNYDLDYSIKDKYKYREVTFIKEISVPGKYYKDILFKKEVADKELSLFLNNLEYKLFIDIEMSMPSFDNTKAFESEVIQAGILLVDSNSEIVLQENYYVKPSKYRYLTKRTEKFLHITYDDILKKGVSYYKFYNKLKQLINKYHPAIITFGKNDRLFLDRSYRLNNLPSLSKISRFVNLNELLKNYYELTRDPGLFNLYKAFFNIEELNQKHDALEDVYVTYLIFEKFCLDVYNNTNTLNI